MKLYSVTVSLRLASGLVRDVVISDTMPSAARSLLATNAIASAKAEVSQWDANPAVLGFSLARVTEVTQTEPDGC